jgi:VanZ family protein
MSTIRTVLRFVLTKKLLRVAWLLAIVAVIVGSLLPPDSAPIRTLDLLPFSDKFDHLGMYALLAFLPALHEETTKVVWWIALGAVALGIALEFAQPYVRRDFEIGDMVADALGVAVGLGAGLPLRKRTRKMMCGDLI